MTLLGTILICLWFPLSSRFVTSVTKELLPILKSISEIIAKEDLSIKLWLLVTFASQIMSEPIPNQNAATKPRYALR